MLNNNLNLSKISEFKLPKKKEKIWEVYYSYIVQIFDP